MKIPALLSAFALLAVPALADDPAAAPAPAEAEAAAEAPAAAPTPAREAPVPAYRLESDDFFDVWIRDRLSIGLGLSYSVLTSPTRPKDYDRNKTFVGFIWKLEDVDQVGVIPELRFRASDHVRLTLSMDRVSGRTRNFNQAKHSDGNVEAMGPLLLAEGLWPLCDDTLFLHAGAGVAYAFADFEEITWWHLGYASEDAWNVRGRPTVHTAQDHYREIKVDDSFGLALAAGASWRPHPRFELDLSVRHVWLEPDCQFGYTYSKRKGGFKKHQDGDFTLDHLAVALTASYVF